jgi:hypothetical protein
MWVTFFNKKGRLLYSFRLCHILPAIATLVILGTIIEEKKLFGKNPATNRGGLGAI